jgi:hypothetical protein
LCVDEILQFHWRLFHNNNNNLRLPLLHGIPFRELLTSVESACNRFLGFRNRIGASEPFLPQRFGTRFRRKKEPGGYERINGRQ